MQEQIIQLNNKIEELQKQIADIQRGQDITFVGNLNEVLIERVMNADLTGTPSDNILLRTFGMGEVLNYPQRIMIYNYKGQRLAIPVYDATQINYPF